MKIISWLNKYFEEFFLSISLIAMSLIMILQVFMRYVMNNSLPWPEELTRYIFIWFAFIGVSYAVRKNSNLRIDILLNYIPPKISKVVEHINDIIFLIFSLIIVYYGIFLFNTLYGTMQTSPGLGIPMAFVYLSLPVGFAMTSIRLIQNLVNRFKGIEKEREEPLI